METYQPVKFWPHVYKTFVYNTFFAKLVAGPIAKSKDFIPQIGKKEFSAINWIGCFDTLLMGYFLKKVIADNLHNITFSLHYPEIMNISGLNLIFLILAYSMQIFADFAGYSLIAIGVGKLFGYKLPVNFNYPYISSSFSEFWQRWHMTLSNWLREYLYIPLGGNRKGKIKCYSNLMIVMVLGGLWHGAAWNFATWGLYHGILLCVERFFKRRFTLRTNAFYSSFVKRIFVFIMVSIGWLFFVFADVSQVVSFFSAIFRNFAKRPDFGMILSILIYATPVVVMHLAHLIKSQEIFVKLKPIYQATMICVLILNSGSIQPFIYFQF